MEMLPSTRGSFIPEVVDDKGHTLKGPELDAAVKLVGEMAQLAQLARIRKALERDYTQGEVDDRILNATASAQNLDFVNDYPHVPWATAFFVNDGPGPVFIAINTMKESIIPLNMGETKHVDNLKANTRIRFIYYWCAPGNTASVRVEGKY